MNQTIYLENRETWLCKRCSTINSNTIEKCNFCNSVKGVFVVIVRPKQVMTHKEWDQLKKFKETDVDGVIFYSDLQMLVCQKFDVRITDWLPKWTRRYRTFKKYVNMRNLNKGIDTFNKGVDQFTGSLDSMTNELGGKKGRARQSNSNVKKLLGTGKKSPNTSIWGKKKRGKRNTIPIWKEKKEKKERRGKRRRNTRSRDEENVDRIWGKRR